MSFNKVKKGPIIAHHNLNVAGTGTFNNMVTALSSFNVSGNSTLMGASTFGSTLSVSGTTVLSGVTTVGSTLNINGNVGIGTAATSNALEVSNAGTVKLGNALYTQLRNVAGTNYLSLSSYVANLTLNNVTQSGPTNGIYTYTVNSTNYAGVVCSNNPVPANTTLYYIITLSSNSNSFLEIKGSNNGVARIYNAQVSSNINSPSVLTLGPFTTAGYVGNLTIGIFSNSGFGIPSAGSSFNLHSIVISETIPSSFTDTVLTGGNVGIGISNPSTLLHVSGNSILAGASTLGSTLNITGALTAASTSILSGATTTGNTLNVAGALTAASTSILTGASTMGSTLNIAGALTAANTSILTGATTVGSTLTVSNNISQFGSTTFLGSSLGGTTDNTNGMALKLAYNTLGNRQLAFTDTGYPSALGTSYSYIRIGVGAHVGAPFIDAQTVGMAAATISVGNSAGVILNGPVTGTSSLYYAGAMTSGSNLNVAGALTAASTSILSGASTMGSTLNVVGALYASSTSILSGASTMGSTLNVIGALSASSTSILSGASTMGSTLNVAGALTAANTSVLNGATTIGSTLNVSSSTYLNGSVGIGTTTPAYKLDVSGDINYTGNFYKNGTLVSLGNKQTGSWLPGKSDMSSASKIVMSSTGIYQIVVGNNTNGLFISSDSGNTWSALTGGLPTLTGSAYWSDGAISANGQYIILSVNGGSLWMSSDYGKTFALTNQATPNIWLPLNGNTTDIMGSTTVTATGTPGYVTINYPGYTAQAMNLVNTAASTATQYIRGTWTGAANFTVSFWFNAQTIGVQQQALFVAYAGNYVIYINPSNQIVIYLPSGGTSLNAITGPTIVINTWYYVFATFQTNGTCSLYVNNTLAGTYTNSGGVGSYTTSVFSLGTYDTSTINSFNGYIDDFKLSNTVSTYVPIPLLQPNIWMPFENNTAELGSQTMPPSASATIYLPFEGTVADSKGFSTVTATGSVTYVPANREGYTGQALRLTNTAGATADQYVKGTWTGATNFTASGWFNVSSFHASNNVHLFFAYTAVFGVYIKPGTNQLVANAPNVGAGSVVGTSSAISLNTWYYIQLIFRTGGLCEFYLNNTLVGSATNTGGVGALSTTQFALGTLDNSTTGAFNGMIDDFRITNSAVPYVPVSIVNVTGSLSYVPGVVGLNAVNLVNTSGGTATNYIRGTCPAMTSDITISGWFNTQSFDVNYQLLFAMYNMGFQIYINNVTRTLIANVPSGSGTGILSFSTPVITNTWYHTVLIFKMNGTCSYYLNGNLIGTATNSGGYGTLVNTGLFSLGTYENNQSYAFNGYIDDFRIYNSAIPYHALVPQNYRSLALSGTGQYALASAGSGWVVGSSDSYKTWTKQAVTVGTQPSTIQPNISGLAVSSWITNGITWVASASTTLAGGYDAYRAFDAVPGNRWVPTSATYSTAGNTSGITTTILGGIGTVTGDWLQLQSSVPVIMASYQFANGFVPTTMSRLPRTFHIIGSNDGTTWYPIQSGTGASSPSTTSYALINSTILVNSSSVQTFGSSTLTTTTYSTTNAAYIYFRLVCLSNYTSGADALDIGEWVVNFARPSTQSLSINHSGQYQMVTTNPVSGSIMPNSTIVTGNTWTHNGVTWTSSGSSSYVSIPNIYYALFNTLTTAEWVSSASVYNTSGNTSGFNTTFYTNGSSTSTIQGDWIQLQSSTPLVMSSYQLANSGEAINFIKSFYIVGSNDGSTWYAIQYGIVAAQPTSSINTLLSNVILVNSASAQTFGTSTMTTTTYAGTTNSYTYFRMIIVSTYNSSAYHARFSEWLVNFQNSVSYSTNYGSTWLNTVSTVSNESVALSSAGQYALSTNTVTPFARLTLDNTNVDTQASLTPATGAGTVTYSSSIVKVGTHSAFFNNTAGSAPSVYLNYTVPSVLNTPAALTMAGWVHPTALSGAVWIISLVSGSGNSVLLGISASGYATVYLNSTSIASYQITTTTTVALNTWTHLAVTFSGGVISFYVNGVLQQTATNGGIINVDAGGNITNLYLGASYPLNIRGYAGYIDDVRIYTSGLNADEVSALYQNPGLTQTIAVSSSYLPIASYTKPNFPSITANIVDSAVSETGQYMIVVTSSTTNNVYYSTDFGVTFTAITVGMTGLVSCSISYDGSYMSVQNANTIYTLSKNVVSSQWTTSSANIYYNTGNVGISTSAPSASFHVSGTSILSGASTCGSTLNVAGALTASSTSILTGATTTGSTLNVVGAMTAAGTSILSGATTTGSTLNIMGALTASSTSILSGASTHGSSLFVSGTSILQGATTTSSSLNVAGSLGIGTTTPSALLHINRSTANFDPSMTITNNTTGALTCGLAGGAGSYAGNAVAGDAVFRNDDSTKKVHLLAGAGNAVMTITNTNVGVGTITPGTTLDVNGIIQGQTAFQSNTNSNNVGMGPLQTVYLGQYGASAPRGTSVRIGDVLGAAYYISTGSFNLSFYKDVSGVSAVSALQIIGTNAANTTPNVYVPNSLGVGTSTPGYKLDVTAGNASITNTSESNGNMFLRLQSAYSACYLSAGAVLGVNSYIGLQSGVATTSALGTPTLVVTNANTVGIGNTNPGYKLDVTGDINFTGNLYKNGVAFTSGGGSTTTTSSLTIGTAVVPGANSAGTTTLVNYGNACLYRNRLIFSTATTDWNHSIYNNGQNNDNEGAFDGLKMNVYSGLNVRVGNANGVVPTSALYINSSAQVGIGTTSPPAWGQTTISGAGTSTNSSNQLVLMNSSNTNMVLMCAMGTTASFLQSFQQSVGGAPLCLNQLGGNVGIGTNAPAHKLHVSGTVDGGVEQYNYNTSAGTSAYSLIGCKNNTPSQIVMYINSSTRTADGGASTGTVRNDAGDLRLQATGATNGIHIKGTSGNVGIGTTAPTTLLDVRGTIYGNSIQAVSGGAPANSGYITLQVAGNTTNTGYVEFRTADTTRMCYIGYGDASSFYFAVEQSRNLIFNTNNVERMRIANTGDVTCTGDISAFASTSDIRLKENIIVLPSALNIIKMLNPVTFNWKQDIYNEMYRGKEDVGFIAQEVEQVIPYAVGDFEVENNKYKKIRHERILPYVVKSVQELNTTVDCLQSENNMMKNTITELTNENVSMKSTIESLTNENNTMKEQLARLMAWAQTMGMN